MIPESRFSSQTIKGQMLNPWSRQANLSRHWGPVALQDPSQGLLVKMWQMRAEYGGNELLLSAPGVPEYAWYTHAQPIRVVSLAFDQNGRPVVAFEDDLGDAFLRWFDPTPNAIVTDPLTYATTPRVTLDDARPFNGANSDVILGYVRAGFVRYRQQRDRFTIEYTPLFQGAPAVASKLRHVSMNSNLRLEFLTDDAGEEPWTLAEIVEDLCVQSGIKPENVDVRELFQDIVYGLKVNMEEGLDKPIDWLREMFFFDKSERDRKIFFPKRGREVVARIPYTDLVRGEPVALKQKRVDESKLAREVTINHLDPDGGYAKNSQVAQRRSNLVKAEGKRKVDSQVVLTADQGATAATTKLKVEWREQIEYEFTTTIKWTELTTADVIEVEDSTGVWHRMRIEERNEDGGNIEWTAKQDGGYYTYNGIVTGNTLKPPVSTTPGVVGETRLEILNIAVLRDQDDELGLYIAAAGENTAWTGYQLLYSIDNGTTYTQAFVSESPATLGDTETDLLAETSYEYQGDQTVDVIVNFPLTAVTYDQLLGNQNRCVIGDEVLQFRTPTLLGMDGTRYRYRLSGLVRGRYASLPEHWPAGTRFVLLDTTVVFAQLQRSMIGVDLHYKPVSIGTTEDETVPVAYLYDDPVNQTEWPIKTVAATRDGSNNVTVTWIGRKRLGLDTDPYHSKYFRGYRVKFSNGHTIDANDETATYSSAPGGVTVQVCGLNEITGEGPYSTAIPT